MRGRSALWTTLLLAGFACGGDTPGPVPFEPQPAEPLLPVVDVGPGDTASLRSLLLGGGSVRIRLAAGRYGIEGLPPLASAHLEVVGAGPDSTVLAGRLTVAGCSGCRIEGLTLEAALRGLEPALSMDSGSLVVADTRLAGSDGTATGVRVRAGMLSLEGVLLDGLATGILVEGPATLDVRHSVFAGGRTGVDVGEEGTVSVVDNLFDVGGCAVAGLNAAEDRRVLNTFLGNIIAFNDGGSGQEGCPRLDSLRVEDPDAIPVLLELDRYPALRSRLPRPPVP